MIASRSMIFFGFNMLIGFGKKQGKFINSQVIKMPILSGGRRWYTC